MTDQSVTEDTLLQGQVRLFQPKEGYRAGLDAVLLGAAVRSEEGGRLLDMGCGAGAAMFCLAARRKDVTLTGLERDPSYLALAKQGVSANGLEGRGEVVHGEAVAFSKTVENRFDGVFSNPPYFAPGAIKPPGKGRAGAYLAETPLFDWLKAMLRATRPGGRITLIHRAEALGDILEGLMARSGEIEVLPVWPEAGDGAKRVLVTARKGLKRGGVRLHAGLVLHEDKRVRAYTDRAVAVFAGGELEWT